MRVEFSLERSEHYGEPTWIVSEDDRSVTHEIPISALTRCDETAEGDPPHGLVAKNALVNHLAEHLTRGGLHRLIEATDPAPDAPQESAADQINRLARFVIAEIPGEPSESEGAVDTAIRVLRESLGAESVEQTVDEERFQVARSLDRLEERGRDANPSPSELTHVQWLLNQALLAVGSQKPGDRSREDRRYAVLRTDLDKAFAWARHNNL